jgi:hypothetical protein
VYRCGVLLVTSGFAFPNFKRIINRKEGSELFLLQEEIHNFLWVSKGVCGGRLWMVLETTKKKKLLLLLPPLVLFDLKLNIYINYVIINLIN